MGGSAPRRWQYRIVTGNSMNRETYTMRSCEPEFYRWRMSWSSRRYALRYLQSRRKIFSLKRVSHRQAFHNSSCDLPLIVAPIRSDEQIGRTFRAESKDDH